MKTFALLSVFAALLAPPAHSQSVQQLKKDLRTKESAAKKDPDAILEVARWAEEKGMTKDAKRLLDKVLKLAPDHAGANEMAGNELVEGKWLPVQVAAEMRRKARVAEFTAKGLVEVKDVWVPAEEVEEAKRGIYRSDGQLVTHEEKLAIQDGMLRHPETGMLYPAKFGDKASSGLFPIRDNRWVDLAEANKFHSEITRPWLVRGKHLTIASTMELGQLKELLAIAELGFDDISWLVGERLPSAERRPLVVVAKTQPEFVRFGTDLGDGTDAAGSFLIRPDASISVPMQGDVRAAVCENHKEWGIRYVRHSGAIARLNAVAEDVGVELPLWFVHGAGALASRFAEESDAGWFGKQHVAKGGVGSIKSFFSSYAIDGSMESKDIAFNIYQGGLLLTFAKQGGDPDATAALQAITGILAGKESGKMDKAFERFEKALIAAQPKVEALLQELISKSP